MEIKYNALMHVKSNVIYEYDIYFVLLHDSNQYELIKNRVPFVRPKNNLLAFFNNLCGYDISENVLICFDGCFLDNWNMETITFNGTSCNDIQNINLTLCCTNMELLINNTNI